MVRNDLNERLKLLDSLDLLGGKKLKEVKNMDQSDTVSNFCLKHQKLMNKLLCLDHTDGNGLGYMR